MSRRYGLGDEEQWLKIEGMLPVYKARHLIENFFAKLKQFRAIARPATTNVLSTFLAVFSLPPPSSYSLRIL